jgi:integrase
MSGLYLVEPGERKGNKYYLVRGNVMPGADQVEVSTKTTDYAEAVRCMADLQVELLKQRVPSASEDVTFGDGAQLYIDWRSPAKVDRQRIDKLEATPIWRKFVRDIVQADIVQAANALYEGCEASTKNRNAVRPIASILHYCAGNNFCAWLRVKRFKEKRAETRAVSEQAARLLLANVPMAVTRDGKPLKAVPAMLGNRPVTEKDRQKFLRLQRQRKLLLMWLFRQGNRITDALVRVTWEKIDLRARSIAYHVGKGDRDVVKPLHEEVFELLAQTPAAERHGPVFPWRDRHAVYKWLRPYAKSLGFKFTPHMARHSVGKWLNEGGASLRSIMDTLDHLDIQSSARYQSTEVEVIRTASERMPRLAGKARRPARAGARGAERQVA